MRLRSLLPTLLSLLLAGTAGATPAGYQSWTINLTPTAVALGGVTWEEAPAGSETQALGDDRIRELKTNIRLRADTDLCWTSAACDGGATTSNSGRTRLGSARAFSQNGTPTTLWNTDALGVNTLDEGRLWVDLDGTDPAELDDNFILREYSSGSWRPVLAMGRVGSATNDVKAWNGSTWLNLSMYTSTITKVVNTTANVNIPVLPAVPSALAWDAAAPDPNVTVPASGTYKIHVTGQIAYGTVVATNTSIVLKEDSGGGANPVQVCKESFYTTGPGAWVGTPCIFDYTVDAPTNGSTYTYSIVTQTDVATAGNAVVNPNGAGFGTTYGTTSSFLQVELSAKVIPKGF